MTNFGVWDLFWFSVGVLITLLFELYLHIRRKRKVEKLLKEYNYHKSTDSNLCCSSCIFHNTRYFKKPDKIKCMSVRGYVKNDGVCDRYVFCSNLLNIW